MKMLADLFPVILFFVAYQVYDIYVATLVAIVAAAIQVAYYKIRRGTVENVPGNPYTYGQTATLTPTAAAGWTFAGWSGVNAGELVDNGDGSWSLTVDGDKALTATFTEDAYDVTVTVVGSGQIRDESHPAGEQLDTAVKREINGIGTRLRDATDLGQLKHALQTHIDTVIAHLDRHRDEEQRRHERAAQQIAEM